LIIGLLILFHRLILMLEGQIIGYANYLTTFP